MARESDFIFSFVFLLSSRKCLSCVGNSQGSCVGLYMINRPEWVISELACAAYSYVSVPLYDTLGKLHSFSSNVDKAF